MYTNLTASNEVSFRFGYDSNSGKYGYILNEGGADTLVPFSAGGIVIESITVTTMPNKSIFAVNEDFDPAGIVVIGTLDDDSTVNVSSMCTFTPNKFTSEGTKSVTVGCFGKTTTINVKCNNIYKTVKDSSSNISEANWLSFINAGGIKEARVRNETSAFLNKKITLSNTAGSSSYTTWVIADFNHDNSGNTCDLIINNTMHSSAFGSYKTYSSSTARSWLLNTYYPGFSTDVKNKLQTMRVASNGSTTFNDKVKLLSVTEVNGSTGTESLNYVTEGTQYPIFNDNSSRVRTGVNANWWLRSADTYGTYTVWCVTSSGNLATNSSGVTQGLLPCIRF